jgi:hypothetical protein
VAGGPCFQSDFAARVIIQREGGMKLAAALFPLLMLGCTKSQPATLSQQKMCADRAEKVFNENNNKNILDKYETYTSHYDATRNICFVEFKAYVGQDGWTYSVSDAFAGREYARIYSAFGNSWCKVDSIECKDHEEFDLLVKDHFGVSFY